MQYNFTDTTERPTYQKGLRTKYNGLVLEDEIEGFQTLNVIGREMVNDILDVERSISGRDGSLVTSSRRSWRDLTIEYRLKTKSREEQMRRFRQLQEILRKNPDEESPIQFTDEDGVTYWGRYEASGEINPATLDVFGELYIHCPDPYKYGRKHVLEGNPITIGKFSNLPIVPTEIEIRANTTLSTLRVSNVTTGRNIVLRDSFRSGDVIRIRIKDDKNQITKNNQNIMPSLTLDSDFSKFVVNFRDVVQVNAGNMRMTLQGRWL